VLRWAQNMRDRVSGFRVAQLLPGIGPSSAARLLDHLAETTEPCGSLNQFKPPPATSEHWSGFKMMISALRKNTAEWPAELDLVCRWYTPHLERIYDDAVLRQADLLQLTQIASTLPSRERFLTELTLDPPDATSGQAGVPLLDEDYLILSTIHSAKGQEWTSVFLLNTVDGCIPSDLATGSTPEIEEERRLLYVAITRAKDHLHLVVPQRFFVHNQRAGDRHVYAQRTRFIPDAVLHFFECRSWPVAKPSVHLGIKPLRDQIDMRLRMRRMWS
jgi:DNA helicase-2/ATP-dependent DNA helicase PcrA